MGNRWIQTFANWLDKRAAFHIHRNDKLYLSRWFIFSSKWLTIYLHKIYESDIELHTHPWDNISFPVGGCIREHHVDHSYTTLKNFRPYFRKAEQPHRLGVDGVSWSVFICFRRRRKWGFVSDYKFDPFDGDSSGDYISGHLFPKSKTGPMGVNDPRFGDN